MCHSSCEFSEFAYVEVIVGDNELLTDFELRVVSSCPICIFIQINVISSEMFVICFCAVFDWFWTVRLKVAYIIGVWKFQYTIGTFRMCYRSKVYQYCHISSVLWLLAISLVNPLMMRCSTLTSRLPGGWISTAFRWLHDGYQLLNKVW